MDKKLAFKEAFTDTFLATFITVPINYVLAFVAVYYSWTPLEITVYFTTVFFIIAVYRKYRVRLYFARKSMRVERRSSTPLE